MRWLIVALVFCLVPLWRIVKRSGMNPILSLLWLLPVANIIFLWVFAYAEWPALRRETAA